MKEKLAALKSKLGPMWWYSLLIMAFSQVGNLVNFYVGAFLVIDHINPKLLGAILPLTKLAGFIVVPLTIITRTFLKYINVYYNNGEVGKIKSMLRDLALISMGLSIILIPILWVQLNFIQTRLKFDNYRMVMLLIAIGIATAWQPAVTAATQGVMNFRRIIYTRVLGPVCRMVVMVLLLQSWQLVGYLYGQLAGFLSVVIFLSFGLRQYFRKETPYVSYRDDWPEIRAYMHPIAIITVFMTLQLALEPWVIRQRLAEDESAAFFVISRFGEIPMFLASAIVMILFPLASKRHESGEKTRKLLLQSMLFVFALGGSVTLAIGLFGEQILGLRSSWATYIPYSRLLLPLGLISTMTCVIQVFSTHQNATRRFGYLKYTIPLVLLEAVILYGLNAWHLFHGVLPEHLWESVRTQAILNLDFIVLIMLLTRLAICAGALIHIMTTRDSVAETVEAA